jgi:tetratricopeptide (TPR) repeat protein
VIEIRNNWKMLAFALFGLAVSSIAFVIVGLSVLTGRTALVLPAFSHSWYTVLEVFKTPLTALFGAGIGNFAVIFPRVKDAEFLSSAYWQLSSFTFSRSLLFHVVTELGILGAAAFILMIGSYVKRVFTTDRGHMDRVIALFFIAGAVITPPTFMFILLFFIWAGYSVQNKERKHTTAQLTEIPALHIGLIIVAMLVVGGAITGFYRVYMAERLYKQALSTTNLKSAYDTMRLAVFQNPYDERIRTGYVGVHMLVANTIAEKAQSVEGGNGLSEQDKQTISQAIQAAIEEAKAVVSLNPRKAANWDVLATVYKNILPLAQGADAWALSAYQRAIILDPQNPTYRLAIGGVYYQLKQYDEAMRAFEQAAMLKNDWPNAQYNYAWAAYQKGDFQKAALAMQSTVSLIDPKQNEADYKKAQSDLEEFKQKLPPETQPVEEPKSSDQSGMLTLPPEPSEVEEKINLPESSSPQEEAP